MFAGLNFECKEVSDNGVFEGHAAATGNIDLGRDVILKGAFKQTITQSKGRVPILWQHDMHSPIGVGLDMAEDKKGLLVKGQLILDVQKAREAHALMKAKALTGLSIGYEIPKGKSEFDRDKGVRYIKEIKLHEYSPVTFPMNERARVTRVKNAVALLLPGLQEGSPAYEDVLHYLEKAAERFDALWPAEPGDAHSDGGAARVEPETDPEGFLQSLSELRQELRDAVTGA